MKVTIEVESIHCVSDSYHTMGDLYNHRHALFIALMKSNPEISWRANNHEDGTMFDGGYFIAGMHLPTGDISYHMKTTYWECLDGYGIETMQNAPKWDGHSSNNVEHRLLGWERKK